MKPREFIRCVCGATVDRGDDENASCNECTAQKYSEVWTHRVSPEFTQFKALLYGCLLLMICLPAQATEINPSKLCDAIYKAEGGAKTKHRYGILKK